MKWHSALWLWLPPLLWTGVILTASGRPFSAANTGSALEKLIGQLLNPIALEVINFIIRKLAHLAEYGILGALWLRAIRADRHGRNLRWHVLAVVLCVIVASLDEWHQAYVPGRLGTPLDVVYDTLGATLAQVLFFKT